MAQPIGCDNEDGNLATLLVTNIHNGDTFAICQGCIPMWAEAMLTEFSAAAAHTAPATDGAPAEAETEGAPDGAPFRVLPEAESETPAPAGADDPQPSPPEPAAADDAG